MRKFALALVAIMALAGCTGGSLQDAARHSIGKKSASEQAHRSSSAEQASKAQPTAAPVSHVPPTGCAATFARAMTSPDVVVPGSFNCQAPPLRQQATQAANISDDAGIARYAAETPVYDSASFAFGDGQGTYFFTFRNSQSGDVACWGDTVNSSGLVSTFGFAATRACPAS